VQGFYPAITLLSKEQSDGGVEFKGFWFTHGNLDRAI